MLKHLWRDFFPLSLGIAGGCWTKFVSKLAQSYQVPAEIGFWCLLDQISAPDTHKLKFKDIKGAP
jgi:hypothetical protein